MVLLLCQALQFWHLSDCLTIPCPISRSTVLLSLHISNEAAGGIFVLATCPQQDKITAAQCPEQGKCFVALYATQAPLGPTLAGVLNVSSTVLLANGPLTGPAGRAAFSGRSVLRTPCSEYVVVPNCADSGPSAMPCRGRRRTPGRSGIVKRVEDGGRMNGATMEPGYTLILQRSKQSQLPHVKLLRIPNGGIFEETESILESSSFVIFSRKFSLPLKATHTHTSSSTGVMRNSQEECMEKYNVC